LLFLQKTKKHLKKIVTILLALCAAPWIVSGQAPVAPIMETSLSRIDSLTFWLYQDIPSHNSLTDTVSVFSKDKETFDLQMSMLGSAIPLDFHASVVAQIQYLMRMPESFFDQLHQRMQLYFPIFEQVLDKYNLPQELKYVSIIESNLNPVAQSWCGAMGLWQFMPYTGHSMGMRIDYSIDERKSIQASTEKACEYFTNSMAVLNDWLLAISSYNVNKAIRRAGTREYWKVRNFLPKETQGYVPRFIATTYVLNFTKFAKFNHDCSSSVLVETPVDSAISISQLASYFGMEESQLLCYNRELLKKATVQSQNQSIMLPYHLSMQFLENKDSVYAFAKSNIPATVVPGAVASQKKWVAHYHTVKSGQTMSSIAKKYGVTLTQLKSWNNRKSTVIHPGQKLKYYKFEWVKA
jgi:membrane-bound lytic murein transglycosylase D